MKIDLEDLKSAVGWIEANTNEVSVSVSAFDTRELIIKCFDKFESEVTITLFADRNRIPKIQRTDNLRWPPK